MNFFFGQVWNYIWDYYIKLGGTSLIQLDYGTMSSINIGLNYASSCVDLGHCVDISLNYIYMNIYYKHNGENQARLPWFNFEYFNLN